MWRLTSLLLLVIGVQIATAVVSTTHLQRARNLQHILVDTTPAEKNRTIKLFGGFSTDGSKSAYLQPPPLVSSSDKKPPKKESPGGGVSQPPVKGNPGKGVKNSKDESDRFANLLLKLNASKLSPSKCEDIVSYLLYLLFKAYRQQRAPHVPGSIHKPPKHDKLGEGLKDLERSKRDKTGKRNANGTLFVTHKKQALAHDRHLHHNKTNSISSVTTESQLSSPHLQTVAKHTENHQETGTHDLQDLQRRAASTMINRYKTGKRNANGTLFVTHKKQALAHDRHVRHNKQNSVSSVTTESQLSPPHLQTVAKHTENHQETGTHDLQDFQRRAASTTFDPYMTGNRNAGATFFNNNEAEVAGPPPLVQHLETSPSEPEQPENPATIRNSKLGTSSTMPHVLTEYSPEVLEEKSPSARSNVKWTAESSSADFNPKRRAKWSSASSSSRWKARPYYRMIPQYVLV